MRDYTPPPEVIDDLKPPLPYTSGTVLQIKQHIPPPPFGPGYETPFRRSPLRDFRERYSTPSRLCLANPPPETPPHPYQNIYSLKIVDQIACSDKRGAQVVSCYFVGHQADLLVAKIFDPLYYDWWDYEPTYLADYHYSREAAAFLRLRYVKDADKMGYPGVAEALEGSIPAYRGCWTFETALLDNQRRDVRMILMNHFPLPSIQSIADRGEAKIIAAELRMQLFAKALELHCWLMYFGVDQRDFWPRNILVGLEQRQVVLLDFSHSAVRDLPNSRWVTRDEDPPNRPKSPIELFGASLGSSMGDWIPDELQTRKAQKAWFKKMWGKSEVFAPVCDAIVQQYGIDDSE